jgi:hypothetical protein
MSFPVYSVPVDPSCFCETNSTWCFAGGIKSRGVLVAPLADGFRFLPAVRAGCGKKNPAGAEDAEYGAAPQWNWGPVTRLL